MKPRHHSSEGEAWVDQPHRVWSKWLTEPEHMHALSVHHHGQFAFEQPGEDFAVALEHISVSIVSRFEQAFQLVNFGDLIFDLSKRVEQLESVAVKNLPMVATIQTFAPERYLLTRPIEVSIRETAEGFDAFFFDANIGASGDNEQEAFDNIKSMILDVFDSLSREAPERLGPEPSRQLEVLRGFIGVA